MDTPPRNAYAPALGRDPSLDATGVTWVDSFPSLDGNTMIEERRPPQPSTPPPDDSGVETHPSGPLETAVASQPVMEAATPEGALEATSQETQKKKKKEKKRDEGLGTSRGIETMFRTLYQTHNALTALADNKANIMISINGIIISILIASIAPGLAGSPWLMIPTSVLLLGCLTSLVFAVLAARPRISRTTISAEDARSGKANILFFGNFVGIAQEDYVEGMQALLRNTDLVYVNMIRDIHSLGGALERKFRLLRISYTAFMIGLVVGVLLLLAAYGVTGVTTF